MNPERGLMDSDEDLAAWLARMTSPPAPQTLNYQQSFAPGVQANINAQVQPQPGAGTQISPTLGLNLGNLSLSGGLQPQGDGTLRPNFGAGLNDVPLAGGRAGVNLSITPEQQKTMSAAWTKRVFDGDFSVHGNYSQPVEGAPQWGVGFGYKKRF